MKSDVTIVTGLWDLGRGDLKGWGNRSFATYKKHFYKLLESDIPMVIWIPKVLKEEVLSIRGNKPTHLYFKELIDFETWNPFFKEIQNIRENKEWVDYAPWLAEAPQAGLPYYNAMMMCKMFMLHDTSIHNPFNSEYFYWIDGGITSTVNPGYFLEDKVFNNLGNYSKSVDKFTFIQYPYTANEEVHGFRRDKLAEYCNTNFVEKVSRGGFFGGHRKLLSKINTHYYNYLQNTLTSGLMGADECLFTIISHNHQDIVNNYLVEGNGLIYPFFENLKKYIKPIYTRDVALYVLTYNSPNQFRTLLKSFEEYDGNFNLKPQKFLLNNSTNRETDKEYRELCNQYGFTEIKKDNIGICGGRQFIAEHFEKETLAKYYMFFEDDMFFYVGKDTVCKNGFQRKIDNLYSKVVSIIEKEKFDFLKLNFTEFFGDNRKQWSWHNVSIEQRKELFPDNPIKADSDVEKAPFLRFDNIKSYNGVPYATGDVYYCNWPQIVSKKGNKKMFLDTKWDHPYEQTWMSYIYQETVKGNISTGILLATPTEHDRFDFYPKEQRREN